MPLESRRKRDDMRKTGMKIRAVKLDYDKPYPFDPSEYVEFASEVLGIKVVRMIVLKSYSGNTHAIVVLDRQITPFEHVLFEYFAFSDRIRAYHNIRRILYNYPGDFSYLFEFYMSKPTIKGVFEPEGVLDIITLAITVKYLSQHEK